MWMCVDGLYRCGRAEGSISTPYSAQQPCTPPTACRLALLAVSHLRRQSLDLSCWCRVQQVALQGAMAGAPQAARGTLGSDVVGGGCGVWRGWAG